MLYVSVDVESARGVEPLFSLKPLEMRTLYNNMEASHLKNR